MGPVRVANLISFLLLPFHKHTRSNTKCTTDNACRLRIKLKRSWDQEKECGSKVSSRWEQILSCIFLLQLNEIQTSSVFLGNGATALGCSVVYHRSFLKDPLLSVYGSTEPHSHSVRTNLICHMIFLYTLLQIFLTYLASVWIREKVVSEILFTGCVYVDVCTLKENTIVYEEEGRSWKEKLSAIRWSHNVK